MLLIILIRIDNCGGASCLPFPHLAKWWVLGASGSVAPRGAGAPSEQGVAALRAAGCRKYHGTAVIVVHLLTKKGKKVELNAPREDL